MFPSKTRPSAVETGPTTANPASPITIQLLQPPAPVKNEVWEAIKTFAPYLAAIIAFIGVLIGLHQVRMGARYNYVSEVLKLRLRQVREFYAPALLQIEQSRIVYEKLLWTIARTKPDFQLEGFRLLDHIHGFKNDKELKPLVTEVIETGKKLTNLISDKSGLIEGGLTSTFIEYLAHFAILNAASKQKLSDTEVEGSHQFGYYPRMLNREIREGFKVVLAHLDNYVAAGDKTIFKLLGRSPSKSATIAANFWTISPFMRLTH